jgi:hypothetical protein
MIANILPFVKQNNPFHVLIGFKVIQVLLDDPDDT